MVAAILPLDLLQGNESGESELLMSVHGTVFWVYCRWTNGADNACRAAGGRSQLRNSSREGKGAEYVFEIAIVLITGWTQQRSLLYGHMDV